MSSEAPAAEASEAEDTDAPRQKHADADRRLRQSQLLKMLSDEETSSEWLLRKQPEADTTSEDCCRRNARG